VLENLIDVLKKREELKAKRNLLFARFLNNPLETQLALKIKIIDDQVAECCEQMRQMRERFSLRVCCRRSETAHISEYATFRDLAAGHVTERTDG
jgi:hypothetical protein